MPDIALPGPIVGVEWLAGHADGVVVCDVRWYLAGGRGMFPGGDRRDGRVAYEEGHIPGAIHVDLDAHLAAAASPAAGRHPLPTPEEFAAGLARLGIGDDDVVVAYDDSGGSIAARLVWMLRAIGHHAFLLDGGISAWPGPLEAGVVHRPASVFTPVPWPEGRLAVLDDVEAVRESGAVLVDARAGERYRGEVEPVDPRPGHIPGALSLPFAGNLDPATGRFLPPPRLRERFAAAGVRAGNEMVSYCGSGVTACHNLLALEHAGMGAGRLYPGSWSQWSADPSRPAAVGEEP